MSQMKVKLFNDQLAVYSTPKLRKLILSFLFLKNEMSSFISEVFF